MHLHKWGKRLPHVSRWLCSGIYRRCCAPSLVCCGGSAPIAFEQATFRIGCEHIRNEGSIHQTELKGNVQVQVDVLTIPSAFGKLQFEDIADMSSQRAYASKIGGQLTAFLENHEVAVHCDVIRKQLLQMLRRETACIEW